MPEVKWVPKNIRLYSAVAYRDAFVPVLTLDAIETWLKDHRDSAFRVVQSYQADDNSHEVKIVNGVVDSLFDDLIRQVQAMKEGRT